MENINRRSFMKVIGFALITPLPLALINKNTYIPAEYYKLIEKAAHSAVINAYQKVFKITIQKKFEKLSETFFLFEEDAQEFIDQYNKIIDQCFDEYRKRQNLSNLTIDQK